MCESEVAQSCPTLSDPMDCSLPAPEGEGKKKKHSKVIRMITAAENTAFLKLQYFLRRFCFYFCFAIAHEAPGSVLAKRMVAGRFSS